jgi:transcription termination factor NusB
MKVNIETVQKVTMELDGYDFNKLMRFMVDAMQKEWDERQKTDRSMFEFIADMIMDASSVVEENIKADFQNLYRMVEDYGN